MMTDPSENKDKFSSDFRTVQESFYDLCGKLEKTKHALQMAEEREAELKKQLTSTENARTETLERYKGLCGLNRNHLQVCLIRIIINTTQQRHQIQVCRHQG